MTDKNIEIRNRIRLELEKIVETSKKIDNIMQNLPHERGMDYRSLKPKSGEYITHSNKTIISSYRDTNGILYEIQIKRIN